MSQHCALKASCDVKGTQDFDPVDRCLHPVKCHCRLGQRNVSFTVPVMRLFLLPNYDDSGGQLTMALLSILKADLLCFFFVFSLSFSVL